MNCIFKRKSIRTFIDKPVEQDKIANIIKAGMQSPTARNTQPWEFLVVQDKTVLTKFAEFSPYSKPLLTAGAAIVTLCNLDKAIIENDYWVQDMSACTQNILLQIVEEGLGGVWLGTYPTSDRVKQIKQLFSLPDNIVPFSTIALGYSNETNSNVSKFDPSRIHIEKY